MESPYKAPQTVIVKVGWKKHKFPSATFCADGSDILVIYRFVDPQKEKRGEERPDLIAVFPKYDWAMYERAEQ